MTRTTLRDVAAAAGVSLASASRALSGGSASSRTVDVVRAAARDLNYLAYGAARALRNGATRRVEFAMDDIGNPNYVAMLRAIESRFGDNGPHVSVTSTGKPSRTAQWVANLNSGGADGLIIVPIRSDENLRDAVIGARIPVVVIGSLGDDTPVDSVTVDSSVGMSLVVHHLDAIGRQNIVFVNGPLDTRPAVNRHAGFYRGVEKSGIDPRQVREVVADDFTMEAGRNVAGPLFDGWHKRRKGTRIDAVAAANDLLALGVIVAAAGVGLRVPEDVAVTGIDDTEFAAMYNPSLTSVSLFAGRRGALAADLLLRRFENPSRAPEIVSVRPKLVVRSSTVTHAESTVR